MTRYRNSFLIEATQWFKNGDHPQDGVGEDRLDEVRLFIAHPELLGEHGGLIEPLSAKLRFVYSYPAIEGAVVRFFRRPEIEFAGGTMHLSCQHIWDDHGWIDDLEGGHVVCPGDWVATGPKGEHWAIKPDIFEATYEKED